MSGRSITIESKLEAGELAPHEVLRHCQRSGCHDRPTRICLCGCEMQLCDTHEDEVHLARQVRMAQSIVRHRAEREAVLARRSRRGEP